MAEAVFITGLAEPMAYAARLLRKKWREGERVVLFGADAALGELDTTLWTEAEREFMPHLRWRSGTPPSETQRHWTPLWLLGQPLPDLNCSTAVNLGHADADWMRGFQRVAELVADDPDAMARARQRWRLYAQWGFEVKHHPQAGSA